MKHQENVTHLDGLTFEYEVEAAGSNMVELPEYVLIDGTRYIPERTCHARPSVDADEFRRDGFRFMSCDACDFGWFEDAPMPPFNYCPHCGAKVVEE